MNDELNNPELIVRPVRAIRHRADQQLYLNLNDLLSFLHTVATSHQGHVELAEMVDDPSPDAVFNSVVHRGASQLAHQLIELLQQTASHAEEHGTID